MNSFPFKDFAWVTDVFGFTCFLASAIVFACAIEVITTSTIAKAARHLA